MRLFYCFHDADSFSLNNKVHIALKIEFLISIHQYDYYEKGKTKFRLALLQYVDKISIVLSEGFTYQIEKQFT